MPFDIGGFIYNGDRIENDARAGIVTNGLVLHLDAGIPESYPRNGTTWYDLSGNGNDGTLTNGPTYSGVNGGVIVLDKVDDYIDVTPINRLNTTTLEIWFNTSFVSTNTSTRQYLYTQQRNPPSLASFTYQERHGIHIAGNVFNFQYLNTDNTDNTVTSITTISANTWYQFAVTLDGSTPIMYLNGQQISSTNSKSNTTSKSFTVNDAHIGLRGDAQGNDIFGGSVSIARDYNRALSATEITQNFNAQRARFGV